MVEEFISDRRNLNNVVFYSEAAGVGDLHPVEMLQDQVSKDNGSFGTLEISDQQKLSSSWLAISLVFGYSQNEITSSALGG